MNTTIRPAEVFHPGEYIRDELEERGWKQADFIAITGADPATLSGVINEKRSINVPLAIALGKAFETSPDLWVGLQFQYDHWHATANDSNSIERKARLYQFPIREMAKRGWVDDSAPLNVLEHQMEGYFDKFNIAAKRSQSKKMLTPGQIAWLHVVKRLSESMLGFPKYSKSSLQDAIVMLSNMLQTPEETEHVPRVLREAGVRFLIVEGLPGLKLDGVCFWIDNNSPVVALTLRHDRIDHFWFVLRHELEHVLRGDAKGEYIPDSFETTMAQDSKVDECEIAANDVAANFCVPQDAIENFIIRNSGYYAKKQILLFAKSQQRHPGLVVGQLQSRGELQFRNLRGTLVKVRDYITQTAMVDGWGIMPQIVQ